eukprot:Gb_34296 [translate_table: standard]
MVGNGSRVCIGLDPWVGSGSGYRLFENLINLLHEKGIFFLHRAADPDLTIVWSQEWKFAIALGLSGREEEDWDLYLYSLKRSHVRIKDVGDALLWCKNLANGSYSSKVWKEVAYFVGFREVWVGDSIKGCLRSCYLNLVVKRFKSLPLTVAWVFGWLEMQVTEELIDKKGAWACFDGANKGSSPSCRAGGVLYLNETHFFKFKESLGGGKGIMKHIFFQKVFNWSWGGGMYKS